MTYNLNMRRNLASIFDKNAWENFTRFKQFSTPFKHTLQSDVTLPENNLLFKCKGSQS